jgi:capsular polysaccharide biosynthesis protein
MDVPQYLRVLWRYKWLLLVGVVVAAAAAMVAGFTLVNGKLVSRTTQQYTAATTVMLGSADQSIYTDQQVGPTQAPGQTVQQTNLAQTAVVYAYLISGDSIRQQVEAQLGAFGPDDKLTAVSRTTQPAGSEQFPGKYTLPMINIVGASDDASRAEKISRTAAEQFQTYVVRQQNEAKVAAGDRIQLTTITDGAAEAAQGSNPAIPLVITGVGVLLVFVALAFVLYNIALSRERTRARRARAGRTSAPELAGDAAPAAISPGGPEGFTPPRTVVDA